MGKLISRAQRADGKGFVGFTYIVLPQAFKAILDAQIKGIIVALSVPSGGYEWGHSGGPNQHTKPS